MAKRTVLAMEFSWWTAKIKKVHKKEHLEAQMEDNDVFTSTV